MFSSDHGSIMFGFWDIEDRGISASVTFGHFWWWVRVLAWVSYYCSIVIIALKHTVLELWARDRWTDGQGRTPGLVNVLHIGGGGIITRSFLILLWLCCRCVVNFSSLDVWLLFFFRHCLTTACSVLFIKSLQLRYFLKFIMFCSI